MRGALGESQQEAKEAYEQYRNSNRLWASRFLLLEAQSMLHRGLYDGALQVLQPYHPSLADPDDYLKKLVIESIALARQQDPSEGERKIAQAEKVCAQRVFLACGEVEQAHALLVLRDGNFQEAQTLLKASLSFAEAHQDAWQKVSALGNLGVISLRLEHYDEALDWSTLAYNAAEEFGAEDYLERNAGNIGWAYFRLGDKERALSLFLDAERKASQQGDIRSALGWKTTAGYVYQDAGELPRAEEAYSEALQLARQINSKEDIINSLASLAHVSIQAGNLSDAGQYLKEVEPMVRAGGNRLDALDITLAQGRLAAARHQNQQAEALFRTVDADPASQISMRLGAEHDLARLDEAENRNADAARMYTTALTTFESARSSLKNEDSRLPFLTNATPIYDDYIRFLIRQNQPEAALNAADQSRARALEQGLGLIGDQPAFKPVALHPQAIAAKEAATLLFYWLGEKQSYLWAITPQKIAVFPLPAASAIARSVDRYRSVLLGPEDPLQPADADGLALYQTLVAPAQALLRPGAKVIVLADGALSRLNFETLIVPGPQPHYWIEDADIVSAPSLFMLAAAKPSRGTNGRLLLVGDAVSPGPDYPPLPNAPVEMQHIRAHFAADDQRVLAGQQANAAAYLAAAPQHFTYIDFVAHGVASRTDPLDSAIILSRTPGADDSFRLYARDIMRHPIDARLVTIAACYGNGTRSYAGEGLVGLSWAFLRAGAHNVIGALWEVSDDSTPLLMDTLYQGLQDGLSSSAALRRAKLALLHASGPFRRPFFWAPFQLYTGL